MAMQAWVERQTDFLRALAGCEVTCWRGIEIALREAGPSGLPDWRDAHAPFLQLGRLDAVLADGRVASIIPYQNDTRWGLCRTDSLLALQAREVEPTSVFRILTLDAVPRGVIRGVSVLLNEGDIAEIRLDVGGREVRLWAGEVHEQADGPLRVVPMDEGVLVQVDGRHPEPNGRCALTPTPP